MNCGIYKILNLINGKIYIGSSNNLCARFPSHVNTLNRNCHSNSHLQSAWNLYGEEAFEFIIIEYCIDDILAIREQYWIDSLKACDTHIGYNIRKIATSNTGIKRSDEFKDKLRIAKLGTKHSEETKKKISEGNKGKIISEETIDKHRARWVGINHNAYRKGTKNNKPNRIWKCPDGQKCKCVDCKFMKAEYVRKSREKNGR